VGVHPHDAAKATEETFATLRKLADHPRVQALGEIGLDYHYDFSPRDVQRSVFERQLAIAGEAGKPVVIHTREAWEDTMTVLRSGWQGGGIMHCFTGDEEQAREALDLGFHLAFGGVLTFPKADSVRQAARITPADRLLVETDCPYLAPVPRRGKRNEPAFLVETALRNPPPPTSSDSVCGLGPVTVKLVNFHEFRKAGAGSYGARDFRLDSG
jgi:TatD DNase family protein